MPPKKKAAAAAPKAGANKKKAGPSKKAESSSAGAGAGGSGSGGGDAGPVSEIDMQQQRCPYSGSPNLKRQMQSTYDIYCARSTLGPRKPWRSYRKVQRRLISAVSDHPPQAGERFDKVAQEYSEDKAKCKMSYLDERF
jgi:hypothetical protein